MKTTRLAWGEAHNDEIATRESKIVKTCTRTGTHLTESKTSNPSYSTKRRKPSSRASIASSTPSRGRPAAVTATSAGHRGGMTTDCNTTFESGGGNLVGARGSEERKWAGEWGRLEQRRRLLENDLRTTGERKSKYAHSMSKSFWSDVLAETRVSEECRFKERGLLEQAVQKARSGVATFSREMGHLRDERGSRAETVRKVRQAMETVEDQLLEFKRNARASYETMMSEEEALSTQLAGALREADAIANAAINAPHTNLDIDTHNNPSNQGSTSLTKSRKASSSAAKAKSVSVSVSVRNSGPSGSGEAREGDLNQQMSQKEKEAKRRIQAIETEIHQNGGEQGGWNPDDHAMYTKLRRTMPNINAMLQKAAKVIPLKDLYSVSAHHAWALRYDQLVAEKKDILESWKNLKKKRVEAAAKREQDFAKRKEAARKKQEKRNIEVQREKAARVKAWRESKRKQEQQQAEERAQKTKQEQKRRAQLFLQEKERVKARLAQKKAENEEFEMQKKVEENRENQLVAKMEEVKKRERRKRVEARNRRDSLRREAKAKEKEQRLAQQQARKKRMLEMSTPVIKVKSKLREKTSVQRARERQVLSERENPELCVRGTAAASSRPAYLGVGKAVPSWMK